MLSKRPSNPRLSSAPRTPLAQDWVSFRVDSIPATATSASLPRYFGEQDRPRIKVLSIVPNINNHKPNNEEQLRLTATLSFAPKTGGSPFPRQIDEKVRTDTVAVDADFVGLTPLSAPPDAAIE